MKRLMICLALLACGGGAALAQSVALSAGRQAGLVGVGAMYQRYTDDGVRISEFGLPVMAFLPLGTGLNLSLQASQATVNGSGLETLSGISDAQVSLTYARPTGESSLVFHVGANLPSGKKSLSLDEYATSTRVGRYAYDFRIPAFGQGLNLTSGATWALPVGERLALGLGASFQYRGRYTPIEGAEAYDPGEEILLTGGADYRLSETAALSGDLTLTLYGQDEWSGLDHEPGNKITVTLQGLRYVGYQEMRLLVRHRKRGKSSFPTVDEGRQTVPDQTEVTGLYRMRLSRAGHLGLIARARLYGETDFEAVQRLFDAGLLPELALGRALSIPARFVFTFGDFSGFEAGLGLNVRF